MIVGTQVSEESFLSDEFLRQLISVGDVDLLVGIPSHNDGGTIGNVVRAVEESVLRNFRRDRIVLVNVDAGSRDGTSQAILDATSLGRENGIESLRTLRWITTSAGNGATQESMLGNILAAADLLHARGCAVVSASAENATPEWVTSLLTPVHRENYDFVAPLYSRHKYDGLLTRNLLYPLSRALYGKPVRELRATEFAFSGRLAMRCLAEGEWQKEAIQGVAEMWMAITAMSNAYRCCQTYLGPKKRASSSAGIVETIRRTVGGIFWCLESTDSFWLKGIEPEPLRTTGPDHQLTHESIRVDRRKLLEMYRSGVAQLAQILGSILDAETHAELIRLAGLDENIFHLSNPLWVRVLYEFAAAYHHAVLHRDHLVQAIVPIYRGRVYSFLTQHRSSGSDAMEADLEDLCQEFERQKAYFIERWKTKGQGAS
jgi:glucosylglycerate synthase